jgi:hypothetical protein
VAGSTGEFLRPVAFSAEYVSVSACGDVDRPSTPRPNWRIAGQISDPAERFGRGPAGRAFEVLLRRSCAVTTKSLSSCLMAGCLMISLFGILGVSACAPAGGGTYANPQVPGDTSTINGDSAATKDRRLQ